MQFHGVVLCQSDALTELTQKLSQTLIPLCSLRPLRFVFWSSCVSPN